MTCGVEINEVMVRGKQFKLFSIRKLWCSISLGYVVPSSILNCIRNVHPMFRGYHQHDTQEFLR